MILMLIILLACQLSVQSTRAVSIKPADFDRLIMPCYLGGSSSYGGSSQQDSAYSAQNLPQNGIRTGASNTLAQYSGQFGRANGNAANGLIGSSASSSPSTYFGADSSARLNGLTRDSLANLGQRVPRANTIDNFIALVSKIEAANPRLANNPDQLIRTLLGRFRMDNYYYDVRSRTPISEQDHRTIDIVPALLNSMNLGQQSQFILNSDTFPEHLLDGDEKCSIYFMLSHFIDKTTPLSPPLSSIPVNQLSGPLGGQRPPVLQAAGAGYPAQSANSAYTSGASGPRYPGPAPSFGSPATSNMNSFSAGLSSSPDYTGKNPYGMNSLQPNNQFNQNYNNLRNTGQYSGNLAGNSKYSSPFIDGMARSRDERVAYEFGVVSVANQENGAIVLNRVLMGILAANTPPQTIRQLSAIVYPTQSITTTPKIDEEIDPLFGVTLADLWAISSVPKPGKPFEVGQLGNNGRWNDTVCQTTFQLERSSSIRFTTAELLGGLDGFNLGMLRRKLIGMRKNLRLSELLRLYYSKTGFRPQFAEVGVCSRGSSISTQMDELRRQAENYLRLYQLNLPNTDNDIALSINRLDAFKDIARQAAVQYAPPDLCQDSSYNDPYPANQQEQCEIAKTDLVIVLDSSPQSNWQFMNLVATKLAQKIGLSRSGNSLSLFTNQQDSTGYAGTYSFNALVKNSTNTAEIGCALVHDTSQSYQGGQITEPTRLIEMFERALVNLDGDYLTRQANSLSANGRPASYATSMFGQSESPVLVGGLASKQTGGSKVIVWFNYGSQPRASSISSSPTNWNGPSYSEQNQYKFHEAKKYLRENFRGASILAVSNNRDDVKAFVYDEERDIFTDIPQGSGSSQLSSADYYPTSSDSTSLATLVGPADQLVGKLLQRICDIPAIFEYPMCFKTPSDNAIAFGYISPGRRQNWMMSPKTFFASRTVRMVFRVEGGRLRVCFGRMQRPDESASRNNQQYNSGAISFGGGQGPSTEAVSTGGSSSGNEYYTGLEHGVCKEVSPGQEIEFAVSDPCYKKSIAECEPFYFVIKETSNPGEGDPNYMCQDEGCKRFDQAKFSMKHSGVVCSSALRSVKASWFLVIVSLIAAAAMSGNNEHLIRRLHANRRTKLYFTSTCALASALLLVSRQVQAQQAGVYDFGQGRYGQKRGNFAPGEVLAIILLIMVMIAGLALTIGLCYYVTKRERRGMVPVDQDDH